MTDLRVSVVGAGYVGLVTAACFADLGYRVMCFDSDERKIKRLREGFIPIFEPGLDEIVKRCVGNGTLNFCSEARESARFGGIQFIAVGTPPNENGDADLTHVLDAAKEIGLYLCADAVIVNKSTVPVGTARKVKAVISEQLNARGLSIKFDVISNPEFLKEGDAIADFQNPDRIVVGADSDWAERQIRRLYDPFLNKSIPFIVMSPESAELTKYAANAMLATRISFMNEVAEISERLGANIDDVSRGIGSDARIGPHFLRAGCGYGGSCFPKDVKALVRTAQSVSFNPEILLATEMVNNHQKQILVRKVSEFFGGLSGKKFGLWGLAFKPNTDDMREAPSLVIIDQLIEEGASVKCFDPVVGSEGIKPVFDSDDVTVGESLYEVAEGVDALLIATEWREFALADFCRIKSLMNGPNIFDGRNMFSPEEMKKKGFNYFSIGRP